MRFINSPKSKDINNLVSESLANMAVSKGGETKKDIPDLPVDINKAGINTEEGGIINSSSPIKREVDFSSYSPELLGN